MTKKNALGGDDDDGEDGGAGRPPAVFIRWTSNKQGSRVAVTDEILESPVGALFGPRSARARPRKMVEEVS